VHHIVHSPRIIFADTGVHRVLQLAPPWE